MSLMNWESPAEFDELSRGDNLVSSGSDSAPNWTFCDAEPQRTSPLYTYLNGQGALRARVQGTDDVSHAALAN